MRTIELIVKDAMSKYLPIAERLREERERMSLNQADFASIAGATRKTQYNYETGERAPDAAYLADIAEAGADVNYILTGVRVRDVAPLDRELELIIGLVKGMDKKQKALAVKLIQAEEQGGVEKERKTG